MRAARLQTAACKCLKWVFPPLCFCVRYLLLNSGSRVSVCQPCPTRESPQDRQHWNTEREEDSFSPAFCGFDHYALFCWIKLHSRCVLVSHRPPRYPTTSLVVRWQWKSYSGRSGQVSLFTCDQCGAGLLESVLMLTISSSTLLDTATLKGWNLLMAEKADSSTSVCGSLRTQAHLSSYSDSLHAQSCERSQVRWYLAASRVPKVQYLTGILSLSALRETITSVTSNRWGWEEGSGEGEEEEEERRKWYHVVQVWCFCSCRLPAQLPFLPLHPRHHLPHSPSSDITGSKTNVKIKFWLHWIYLTVMNVSSFPVCRDSKSISPSHFSSSLHFLFSHQHVSQH